RIGPDQRVREVDAVFTDRNFCQILEIDLVADTNPRRDHAEAVESLHAPFQEFITGSVALELHLHIQAQRIGYAREIDLDGVVDYQIDRHQRLDQLRILAQPFNG